MANLDLTNVPKIEWPRVKIFIMTQNILMGLIMGNAKITNIPEGAEVYKIVMYRPEDTYNTISLWLLHPSFDEVPTGNIVEMEWVTAVPIEYHKVTNE